ncbi:MAG: histidine phosphatase family protein [Bryobacteraceae bacterium]
MPKLYLVRHAEPAITGVLLGRSDPPLSARGREQARAATLNVRAVYTSPLRRARETAEIMAPSAAIEVLPDLIEISHGEWNGKTWTAIERDYPEIAAQKEKDWFGAAAPGGEDWDTFIARVDAAFERVKQGPFPAAVVAHFAVNARIAQRLRGIHPLQFTQGYCEPLAYEI